MSPQPRIKFQPEMSPQPEMKPQPLESPQPEMKPQPKMKKQNQAVICENEIQINSSLVNAQTAAETRITEVEIGEEVNSDGSFIFQLEAEDLDLTTLEPKIFKTHSEDACSSKWTERKSASSM